MHSDHSIWTLYINSSIILNPFNSDKLRVSPDSYVCKCPFVIKFNLPGRQVETDVFICFIFIRIFEDNTPEAMENGPIRPLSAVIVPVISAFLHLKYPVTPLIRRVSPLSLKRLENLVFEHEAGYIRTIGKQSVSSDIHKLLHSFPVRIPVG